MILDSGAFSIDTGKVKGLSIEQYDDFLRRESARYTFRFNFDKIGDGAQSYRNWLWLRERGHDVIPVFHVGTDERWLAKYLRQTDHIAMGGIAGMSVGMLRKGLSIIWDKYLLRNGKPTHRVHGLGMTSERVMAMFPWDTVDSTSALLQAGYAGIRLPTALKRNKAGALEEDLSQPFRWAKVASREGSLTKVGAGTNAVLLTSWPQRVQALYREYLGQWGFEVGPLQLEPNKDRRSLFVHDDTEITPSTNPFDLSRGWEPKLIWNAMFYERWSERIAGPKIYLAGSAVSGVLRNYRMLFPLLVSFASKESGLEKIWSDLNANHDREKGPAAGAELRLARTR